MFETLSAAVQGILDPSSSIFASLLPAASEPEKSHLK